MGLLKKPVFSFSMKGFLQYSRANRESQIRDAHANGEFTLLERGFQEKNLTVLSF